MIHYDPLQAETVVSKKSTISILHSLYIVMPWQLNSAILARRITLAFQHKRWLVYLCTRMLSQGEQIILLLATT